MAQNLSDIQVAIAHLQGTKTKMDESVVMLNQIRQGLNTVSGNFGSVWEGIVKDAFEEILKKTEKTTDSIRKQVETRARQLDAAMEKYIDIESVEQQRVDALDTENIF